MVYLMKKIVLTRKYKCRVHYEIVTFKSICRQDQTLTSPEYRLLLMRFIIVI